MTLLELLVAVVVSSVVMMGVGGLYQTAMMNYNVVRDVRESVYAATQTNDRIQEAVRKANPRCVFVRPDSRTLPAGAPRSNVLVYNYSSSNWQSAVSTFSGIVFCARTDRNQRPERLLLYESQMGTATRPFPTATTYTFTAIPGSFNFSPEPGVPVVGVSTFSDSQLATWMDTVANQRRSEVVGIGVARFTASRNTDTAWVSRGRSLPRAVTWDVQYLQAGR